tara:strand:+ start:234 stop:575 length:342 start_codon:yes stop_codon:yes gene_type:complete
VPIRKNKKRIDPRYFLNETAYRDLQEWDSERGFKMDKKKFAFAVHKALHDNGYKEGKSIHTADAYQLVADALGVETEQIARLYNNFLGIIRSSPEEANVAGIKIDGDQISAVG